MARQEIQMARQELTAEKLTAYSSRTENLDSAPQLAASPAEPQHVTPPCPHFGTCGGCQLQHLAYPAQLELKATRLRAILANFKLPELQLHASPPLAYRNRIRLTLAPIDGRLRAGYLGTATQKKSLGGPFIEQSEMSGEEGSSGATTAFVPITQCPIAAPLLWRGAEAFLALANSDDATWLRLNPDQLELFTTADESRLQLTLYLRASAKSLPAKLSAAFAALCEILSAHIPALAGAGIALLPARSAQRSRRTEVSKPGPTWGSPGLSYSLPQLAPRTALEPRTSNLEPLNYWVPRGAFFQANRFLLPELLAAVTAAASASRDSSIAWDLYAGIGLFSRALVRSFTHVTAVEIAEPAATALAQTKLPNLRAVKATTLDFLRSAVLDRDRPAAIILDPPRAGLGDEVCALLARIAAPTLVYVSCSPLALASDLNALAALTAAGYAIDQLHLFDLFPQTTHIETVAILTRQL
jgi:23S rRNA (uracil1939-C5)-methyltransferase